MSGDDVIVLHSVGQRWAAKRFTRTKTGAIKNRSYQEARHFRVETVAVIDFSTLCASLTRLTRESFAFVIRGKPLPGINRAHTRRLVHRDRKTGDEATFAAAPHHWFAIDLDHILAGPLVDPVADPADAIEYLIGLLPGELADSSTWWQFTSSQSLPGGEGMLSVRLWFWNETALDDAELTRWAKAVNRETKLIDPSLYRAVQAHYVAAPLFENMSDPLPRRIGVRRGLEDTVCLIIPPADVKDPEAISGQGYEPGRGAAAWLAEIGGERGFRDPIKSAIASYIAIHGSKADCESLKAAIRTAVDQADPGGRDAAVLERYKSNEHLDELIGWVRDHHGDQPPKGFTPEPPPEFDADTPPPTEPEDAPGSPPRPVVRLVNGELPLAIDVAETLLIAADRGLYAYGEQVVRPAPRPIRAANHGTDKTVIGLRLVPVAAGHMVERFTRIIEFQKYNPKIGQWLPVNCPREFAATYLERVGLWHLPQLSALTTCPLLLADGRVLDCPGYDPDTGILFDPQGVTFPPVAPFPTRSGARQAFELLAAPFTEFPFVGGPSKSVLWSALLSGLVRSVVSYVPAHAFTAPAAGTGKSKLVDCVSILLTGRECAVVSQATDETEFEKKLGAVLLAGDPIVSIDNCTEPVGSALLCMALSQAELQVRILGLSKTALIPNNAMVFLNGNNLAVIGDLLRRTLIGKLDAGVERPELRSFTSEDPVAVFKRDRPQLVSAALTVLRGYIAAGQPRPAGATLGGFEDWCRLVRGGLIWLGEDDPLDTIEEARAADPELQRRAALFEQWWTVLQDEAVTAREVIARACRFDQTPTAANPNRITYHHPEFRTALLDIASERGRLSPQSFGKWLGASKNKVVGELRLIAAGLRQGYQQWKMQHQNNGGWE